MDKQFRHAIKAYAVRTDQEKVRAAGEAEQGNGRMRVEKIGKATLYLGDCLEILPTLGKVDAVVTDPPYGIDWVPRQNHTERLWVDDKQFDPTPFLEIGSEHLFWGANYFCRFLPHSNDWFTWMKRPSSGFEKDSRTYSMAEMAWSDLGCKQRVVTHVWDGGKRQGLADNRTFCHPSQKPIEVMEWCLGFVKGGTILDPFMGSGTTGVACMNLGREFIGIEIEEKYFDIACSRIEAAQQQGDLFREDVQALQPEQTKIGI